MIGFEVGNMPLYSILHFWINRQADTDCIRGKGCTGEAMEETALTVKLGFEQP
jgi:hypothetical protein